MEAHPMRLGQALEFLRRQDPDAILVMELDASGRDSPGGLAAPGGPSREEVKQIAVEDSIGGSDIVVFR